MCKPFYLAHLPSQMQNQSLMEPVVEAKEVNCGLYES